MENLEFILHDLNYVGDYKQYEEERQSNEKIRIANENERIANETARVNQEETRKAAEIKRDEEIEKQLFKLKETEEDFKRRVEAGEFRGEKGEKGDAPVRGVDYWTESDIETIKNDNKEYIDTLIGTPLDFINGEVI